ncbi:MAG: hypothetical protein GC189_03110 [Alphaproteobacteria bacterium]|nr:hypothetical protein [Alphaproteobacteria bacterium]
MARRRSSVRRANAARSWLPLAALAAAVLTIGAIVLITMSGGDPAQRSNRTADDMAAAGGRAATRPARAAESFTQRLTEMWTAAGRVEALEAENEALRAWRDIAQRLAERNARYEALLRMPPDAFGEGVDVTSAIAAQVVLDSGGPFTRTMVANAGAEHGVRVGFIALNENGLVGRVVSVGARSSRILLLDDYNSRVPVMGASSRVRALMVGQASRPPDLSAQPLAPEGPSLEYAEQNLREGERVITTGDGGLFPRGLTVGVAHLDVSGQWRLTQAASQSPVDFVRITPYSGLATPESEGVVADPGPPARTGAQARATAPTSQPASRPQAIPVSRPTPAPQPQPVAAQPPPVAPQAAPAAADTPAPAAPAQTAAPQP